ncbi:hypothetical protein [Marinomonas epiphytica]
MPSRLRYSRSKVINHLASNFVLGLQTERVRRHVQKLRITHLHLDKAILVWQEHFTQLDELTLHLKPPDRVWKNVEHQLFSQQKCAQAKISWYKRPFLWWTAGVSSLGTSILILTVFMFILQGKNIEKTQSIGYLAVMTKLANGVGAPPKDTQFVITAYKGKHAGQSRAHIQWVTGLKNADISQWELFSVEKGSGAIISLGLLVDITSRNLTAAEWGTIKNSEHLRVEQEGNIIFSGPCLQLTGWGNQI